MKPWNRRGVRLAVALGALYCLFCGAVRWVSTGMIFPAPPPTYTELPGLRLIPGTDGREFAAVYLENPSARHLLIYFHGNGEDLGMNRARFAEFRAAGFAVLAVDYPGYGLSQGRRSEEGFYASADAAWRYATGPLGWAKQRVIVYGTSLGGAAAVWVASHEAVGGVVLESTFTSAYRVMTRWPVVLGERMPSLARMGRVRSPVLVLHGTEDRLIDVAHGRALYSAAPGPKRALWVEGAGHCQVPSVAGARYWKELTGFADSLPR